MYGVPKYRYLKSRGSGDFDTCRRILNTISIADEQLFRNLQLKQFFFGIFQTDVRVPCRSRPYHRTTEKICVCRWMTGTKGHDRYTSWLLGNATVCIIKKYDYSEYGTNTNTTNIQQIWHMKHETSHGESRRILLSVCKYSSVHSTGNFQIPFLGTLST